MTKHALDFSTSVKEDVVGFEVPVNYPLRVNVSQPAQTLPHHLIHNQGLQFRVSRLELRPIWLRGLIICSKKALPQPRTHFRETNKDSNAIWMLSLQDRCGHPDMEKFALLYVHCETALPFWTGAEDSRCT